jgi:hypothetical protein
MTDLKACFQLIVFGKESIYPYDLHLNTEDCKQDLITWVEDMIFWECNIKPNPIYKIFPSEPGQLTFRDALQIFRLQKGFNYEVHLYEQKFDTNGKLIKLKQVGDFFHHL